MIIVMNLKRKKDEEEEVYAFLVMLQLAEIQNSKFMLTIKSLMEGFI